MTTTSGSLAMQSQGKSAGSASALLGLLPFILGAAAAPLVGIAGSHTALPMAVVILFAISARSLVLTYWFGGQRLNEKSLAALMPAGLNLPWQDINCSFCVVVVSPELLQLRGDSVSAGVWKRFLTMTSLNSEELKA
ncbi:hypothetical protein PO124_15270 [Bacillus licheniformis]|nr:hypothetical protein [Bacillus licheniformis]